ncbi:MAG: hypothetical protein COU06_00250 [Candidatus Harrisonbacteria bacterium CG10_big_fil_rev_8_21_14_0_10_38_8]|uniref:RecF/RecN/SMC N-terminal domain-containing protein n=1 Tax=Candidatus Harrisonbacteria bacterium CG10_big_fil_rev_8_21_14_0_10_38_8 TaxID=1974582 RepID=A0A2M6WKT5_9BACT|nr:MAG: hypothetical protein COU06_00250 [Candidatus Harrisonbacteria bacterium CG10_big_fil_rev_8_21_14_0_10_38_8]
MYLRKLELLGFKSFAQKTSFDLSAGVTAIVGPNGSGKSNVIDAIRWVLGETQSKNIRADRSENLIFSGTAQKARSNFAEAVITFDNSTNFFPVDFSEVSVKRRVTRDGKSSYFINDSEVRLKDIVDFFAQVRLGTRGFSIINQGNSDLFIRASQIERRMMLEEVLGLRQYHIKKKEAERKLESTFLNLEKSSSLVEELLPHLRILRRQKGKWEKYGELTSEKELLEAQYFSYKLGKIKESFANLKPEVEKIEAFIIQEEKTLKEKEEVLKLVEKNQPKADEGFSEFKKKQNDILQKRSDIQRELGKLEAKAEYLSHTPKNQVSQSQLLSLINSTRDLITKLLDLNDIQIIKQELTRAKENLGKTLEGDSKENEIELVKLKSQKESLMMKLEELETQLKTLDNSEDTLTDKLKDFNHRFKLAYQDVEEQKEKIRQLQTQKNRFGFEKEKIEIRRSDLAHEARQNERNLEEFENTTTDIQDIGEVETKLMRVRGVLASIGDIDQDVMKEAQVMEERYAFLSVQIADLKESSQNLKKLINDLKEKLHKEFTKNLKEVNEQFNEYFRLMFNGGKARLYVVKKKRLTLLNESQDGEEVKETEEEEFDEGGLEIELSIPRKNIKGLDMLSGGERSLVSIAVLFALISVSPPPFLVLDEIDAALDENNTKRFSNLIENFSNKTQFILVTHNRATMSCASVLYGVTMPADGTSKLLSIKLEDVETSKLTPNKP